MTPHSCQRFSEHLAATLLDEVLDIVQGQHLELLADGCVSCQDLLSRRSRWRGLMEHLADPSTSTAGEKYAGNMPPTRHYREWVLDQHSCTAFQALLADRGYHDEDVNAAEYTLLAIVGHCGACTSLMQNYPIRPRAADFRFPPGIRDWELVSATASAKPSVEAPPHPNAVALVAVSWHSVQSGSEPGVAHLTWESKRYSDSGWELWLYKGSNEPPARRIWLGRGYRGNLTLTSQELGFDPTRDLRAYAVMPALPEGILNGGLSE